MPKWAPQSFDLVFADPPYFLSNGGFTCQGGKRVADVAELVALLKNEAKVL